jgi:predicted Zn-dependent peptidase
MAIQRKKRSLSVAVAALLLGAASFRPGLPGELRQAPTGPASAAKRVLANGLTVLLDKDDSSATTVLRLVIKGGRRAEPPLKQGLSFLTTRLAIEIPDSTKVQELMRLATRFSVTSQGDYSLIGIECLSVHFDASLKVFSQILRDPLFSGLRIDAVKRYMEHQGRIEEDDSVTVGHLANLRAFFGNPGYQGSIHGDPNSLRAIKAKDVSDYYKRFFTATQMIVSVSSDLSPDIVEDLLEKYLGGISGGVPATPEPAATRVSEERTAFVREIPSRLFSASLIPSLCFRRGVMPWPIFSKTFSERARAAGFGRCAPI